MDLNIHINVNFYNFGAFSFISKGNPWLCNLDMYVFVWLKQKGSHSTQWICFLNKNYEVLRLKYSGNHVLSLKTRVVICGPTLEGLGSGSYLKSWVLFLTFLVCYWKRVQISKEMGNILEKELLFEKWFVGVYTLTHFCIILQVMSVSVLLYHHRTMLCNWMKDLLNTQQLQRKTVKYRVKIY